jgi:beta-lactamase regulating signal transducer with metallopeptidase domain
MTDFLFRIILPMAFTGCAFALLLFAVYPLLRRLPAKLRRFVLLGAAVLFILPLSLLFMQSSSAPRPLSQALQQAAPTAPVYQAGEVLHTALQQPEPANTNIAEPGRGAPMFAAPQIITGIYLMGILAFVATCGARYVLFNRRLRHSCSPVPEKGRAAKLLRPLCTELKIKRLPSLAISPLVSSPVLVGILRPRIILPAQSMTQSQCTFALRHELTHLKQGDIAAKGFLLAVNALHWWCPALPALRRAFALACEDACDESIAQTLNGPQRKNYAETLLHFAGGFAPYATAGLVLPIKNLRRRLQRLLRPATPSRLLRLAGAIAIALVLSAGLLAGCSFAAGAASPSGGVLPESLPGSGSSSYLTATEILPQSTSDSSSTGNDEPLWAWPLPEWTGMSRGYLGDAHKGIDLDAPAGTTFVACGAGTVLVSDWHWNYGYYIMIDHGEGIVTLYAHASELYVAQGDSVEKNQPIGAVGATGVSTGNALHIEFQVDGQSTDPLAFLITPGSGSSMSEIASAYKE